LVDVIRTLQAELLDDLPADDPDAIHSRRDLRRLNTLMGHAGILARSLQKTFPGNPPSRILEIGAGDGHLLLRVAHHLSSAGSTNSLRGIEVLFVDLQNLLTQKTKADFAALNWTARSAEADIFQWLTHNAAEKIDVVLGNLVLHHFTDTQLSTLFSAATKRADALIAVEPRRSAWPLFWTQWLSLIGCNAVTCHDARISVCAGFTGRELSALWPKDGNWELTERRAGLFSHLFIARRKD
jgi:SAM-dependent methyltransferase